MITPFLVFCFNESQVSGKKADLVYYEIDFPGETPVHQFFD